MPSSLFPPRLPSAWARGIVFFLGIWLAHSAHGAEPGPFVASDDGPTDAAIDRAITVFRDLCVECHDLDGRGESGREMMRKIPDLTDSRWHTTRSDLDLTRTIVEGKRPMPAMKPKLPADEVEAIVRLVRTFKDGKFQIPEDEEETESSTPVGPAAGPVNAPTANRRPGPAGRGDRRPAANLPDSARALFQRLCVSCHDADGTGNRSRDDLLEIPDFTDNSWQARRSDGRLLTSILDGRGAEMPPSRGKIDEEQARSLVAYVRSLDPSPRRSGGWGQDGLASAESASVGPPPAFFEKLIRWLGKFHPPVVHFPIALLTAAAVAELLRLATGKPAFDAITRFCVWFGTLAAVVAGILGWFLGGFRFTDASWVMMMHRWIGTLTVAIAVLVLVQCELSRSPARQRIGRSFRLTLFVAAGLVSVAGFLGGAVVYGIDHYAWPR
jgi:mono/diheme cytochrome c family protein/uncharacterized membrane protein